jgi:gamma-glutamyl-gamma-aminobutyrate hydrolase PuuD
MAKIIGIPGWKVGDNSFGVTTPYLEFFSQYGVVKILTPEEEVNKDIDLLVLPGGADIDTNRYSSIPSLKTGRPDPIKEYFDINILPKYIENKIPVFGICRGMQSIAVMFGAKLVQHIINHETNDEDRSSRVHGLAFMNDGFKKELFRCYELPSQTSFKVNSLHHQCILSSSLPEHLNILAVSKGKFSMSCVEVIMHSELPIAGVQYHPEELMNDIISEYLINLLISKK